MNKEQQAQLKIHQKTNSFWTSLAIMSQNPNDEFGTLLLNSVKFFHSFPKTEMDGLWNVLHIVASKGYNEHVKAILNILSNPNIECFDHTPLNMATKNNRTEVAKTLLCNDDVIIKVFDMKHAIENNNLELVKLIEPRMNYWYKIYLENMELTLDPQVIINNHEVLLHLSENNLYKNCIVNGKISLFYFACFLGLTKVVENYLKSGHFPISQKYKLLLTFEKNGKEITVSNDGTGVYALNKANASSIAFTFTRLVKCEIFEIITSEEIIKKYDTDVFDEDYLSNESDDSTSECDTDTVSSYDDYCAELSESESDLETQECSYWSSKSSFEESDDYLTENVNEESCPSNVTRMTNTINLNYANTFAP